MRLAAMKLPLFSYIRASSIDEAIEMAKQALAAGDVATAQDVFAQVVRYLPRFEGRADFRTWLFKLCISQVNRRRRFRWPALLRLGRAQHGRDRGLVAIIADAHGFHGLITRFDLLNHLFGAINRGAFRQP